MNLNLINLFKFFVYYNINIHMGIGDWGLGVGANPQSPIPR